MPNGNYEYVKSPDGFPGTVFKDGYSYKHHVVYWQHYRVVPSDGELIHHLNENRKDNRIENLELISRKEHSSNHHKKKTYIALVCSYCGINFEREKRRMNFGQQYYYCCRSHSVKHQHIKKKLQL